MTFARLDHARLGLAQLQRLGVELHRALGILRQRFVKVRVQLHPRRLLLRLAHPAGDDEVVERSLRPAGVDLRELRAHLLNLRVPLHERLARRGQFGDDAIDEILLRLVFSRIDRGLQSGGHFLLAFLLSPAPGQVADETAKHIEDRFITVLCLQDAGLDQHGFDLIEHGGVRWGLRFRLSLSVRVFRRIDHRLHARNVGPVPHAHGPQKGGLHLGGVDLVAVPGDARKLVPLITQGHDRLGVPRHTAPQAVFTRFEFLDDADLPPLGPGLRIKVRMPHPHWHGVDPHQPRDLARPEVEPLHHLRRGLGIEDLHALLVPRRMVAIRRELNPLGQLLGIALRRASGGEQIVVLGFHASVSESSSCCS